MSEKRSSGAFGFGFLLGTLAGALAAALLTPRPGAALREELRERGIELTQRARVLAEQQAFVEEPAAAPYDFIPEGDSTTDPTPPAASAGAG